MSCSTAYLVRDVDGIWRTREQKRGSWFMLDARARDEVLAAMRDDGVPLDRLLAHGGEWLRGWLCRGVLIDTVERRLRFYACYADTWRPRVGFLESIERAAARAPVWAGWDVAYAWGGREEFAEVVPEAASLIEPEPFEQPLLDDLCGALLPWDESLVGWDRQSLSLRHRYDWWVDYSGLLSVIDERLDVLDFGFAGCHRSPLLLPWLMNGEPLLDALASAVPHPVPRENEIDDGVVIDCPARRIRYWSANAITPALLAAVRAAWPGWAIERLRYGLAGHLAATGRRDPSSLLPDAELPTTRFDTDWLRERATLSPDARGLRCIENVWIDS